MGIAGLDDLAQRRRKFAAPLDARAGIADVDHHLVRVLLQDGADRGLEPLRIAVLVNSICGEQGQLAAQDQGSPTVRGLRGLSGGKP